MTKFPAENASLSKSQKVDQAKYKNNRKITIQKYHVNNYTVLEIKWEISQDFVSLHYQI